MDSRRISVNISEMPDEYKLSLSSSWFCVIMEGSLSAKPLLGGGGFTVHS